MAVVITYFWLDYKSLLAAVSLKSIKLSDCEIVALANKLSCLSHVLTVTHLYYWSQPTIRYSKSTFGVVVLSIPFIG